MVMALRKEEEQPFDLDTFAISKQLLQAARSQVRQAPHQHIDLMERRVLGQFIQQLKHSAFWRGKNELPVPLSPRHLGQAQLSLFGARFAAYHLLELRRDQMLAKKPVIAVVFKSDIQA